MSTGGLKFRSHKRVYLQQPGRVTRSKKSIAQPDASLTPEGDGLALHDDNIDMTTKGDSITRPDEDNHMDTEDVIFQHNDNIDMTTEDAIFQHNDNIDMTTEGDSIPRPVEDSHMDTKGEE
ncbi:hypothetical protein GUJ93_ZPchr0006g44209 [Zizania palustris]|uniref:Uncharacterized protein n=1 Tax=Zizania palustris TaxID=103762 RepID=A0A8J5T7E1_ZIZPA|nr:hypothetical protein GUJ93_ZPchr0006g44209 [Zizania palustris]